MQDPVKRQLPFKTYNISRCSSAPLLKSENGRQAKNQSTEKKRQRAVAQNYSKNTGHILYSNNCASDQDTPVVLYMNQSRQETQAYVLYSAEKNGQKKDSIDLNEEPIQQQLMIERVEIPDLQNQFEQINSMPDNDECINIITNETQFTERTELTQITNISQVNESDQVSYFDAKILFQSSETLREIYELANFYQERNNHRIDNNLSHLFHFTVKDTENEDSDSDDYEEDESLPKVSPPYLPSKADGISPYTLVLDLDETLIHFEDHEEGEQTEDNEVFYMVRPGVHKFLTELSQYYEIIIFTAALKDYADWILNSIDRKKVISHRLYREHTKRKRHYAIKDLSKIGRDMSKTLIIDNIAENFTNINPDNGLEIVSWYDDLDDNELEKFIPFLKAIYDRQEPDIRPIINKYRNDFQGYINQI